jgi:hypothetical protein
MAIAATALAGAIFAAALTLVLIKSAGPTILFTGLNGCIPPCPHSTVEYGYDWRTGQRFATITTRDVDGTWLRSEVVDAGGSGYTLPDAIVGPGLGGAAIGGALGVWAVGRRRRRTIPPMAVRARPTE